MKKNSIVSAIFGFLFGSVCTLLATYIIKLRGQNKLTKNILNMVLDMISDSDDEDFDIDDVDTDDVDTDDELATCEDLDDCDGDDSFDKVINMLKTSADTSSDSSGKIIFEDEDGNPLSKAPSLKKSSSPLSQKNQTAKHQHLEKCIDELAKHPGQEELTQASFESLHHTQGGSSSVVGSEPDYDALEKLVSKTQAATQEPDYDALVKLMDVASRRTKPNADDTSDSDGASIAHEDVHDESEGESPHSASTALSL